MLVEKKATKNPQVKNIKLVNGEELMAYISSVTPEEYLIQRPLLCTLSVDPRNMNQAQVSFTPWLMCSDFKTLSTRIKTNDVLVINEPKADSKNQYISSVGHLDVT